MTHPTLVQFRFSHYNEKARWALDYKAVPHVRRTLLPGFHAKAARKLTRRTVVPILVLADGGVIADSTRIIAALEASHPQPPLYPQDPAECERALALEDFFDEEVGPYARHAMFYLGLSSTDFIAGLFAGHKGPLFRRIYAGGLALRRKQAERQMNLVPDAFDESQSKLDRGLARLEKEIGAGNYLVGGHFSVADLTAAALLSPLVMPDEYPHPPAVPPPVPVREFQAVFAERPGIAWVREMYRKHRGVSAAISE